MRIAASLRRERGVGHAADDTLSGLEGVIGTSYVDTLTGDDGDNVPEGGGDAEGDS